MNSVTRHYVLAAGGTGGHLTPAFALAAELGAGAEYQHLDVTSEAAWEALIADIVVRHGRLDH